MLLQFRKMLMFLTVYIDIHSECITNSCSQASIGTLAPNSEFSTCHYYVFARIWRMCLYIKLAMRSQRFSQSLMIVAVSFKLTFRYCKRYSVRVSPYVIRCASCIPHAIVYSYLQVLGSGSQRRRAVYTPRRVCIFRAHHFTEYHSLVFLTGTSN